MPYRICLISLGCAKNQVNSEQMLYLLNQAGHDVVGEVDGCDVAIVNTCGFIDTAKSEAIDQILQLAEVKKAGGLKKILVAGCLSQRYKNDILESLPEVDGMLGTGSFGEICQAVEDVMHDGKPLYFGDKSGPVEEIGRVITTGPGWAYLRIAEGCDNWCAFCAIPAIRGRYRSRALDAIVQEAKELAALGVNVSCIYERNESLIREKESMTCGKGPYAAPGLETNPSGHAEICENGIYFDVDYINGQKTGYFLDQKYNRAAAGRLAHGRRVLDCFTHTGAFALHCAAGGAESVTAVDVSASALEQARRNAERNGLEGRMEFRQADVFELLTELGKSGAKPWDYIILDPPAFTKSGATVENARRGYREINRRAMQILPRGGYLATCSCSHFMTDTLFRAMLADAARDASVQLRQIEARQQSPDHPILWGVPETDYLKFYLFQIV